MARIRTLKRAIEELKSKDPNCDLTLSSLRRKVLNNEIPYSKCGVKYLVDVDIIENAIFNNEEVHENEIT